MAYVNVFLFMIYFTYIIIGGVVFMWLEKPEEERVCRQLNEEYKLLKQLEKEGKSLRLKRILIFNIFFVKYASLGHRILRTFL